MTPPDHVTGLASRGDLQRLLDSLLVPDGPRPVALAICDVVALESVNERDGFLAGDAVLASAAAAFRAAAGDAILLARLGGDELVAIFAGPTAPTAANRAAASLAALAAPRLHAAAVIAEPADESGSLIDRLYATMRRS